MRRLSLSSGLPPVSRGSSPATIASNTAGTPAITCTLPRLKPGAFDTGFSISSAPSGIRAMRSRAGFRSTAGLAYWLARIARASSRTSMPTPKAAATASAVTSSWVGPMPPEVKTWV